MSDPKPIVHVDSALLLVVDLQDRLLAALHEADACVSWSIRMIKAAHELNLPMIVTEQHPDGLGPTAQAVRDALTHVQPVSKMRFSACTEEVSERLASTGRPHIIVVGVETHVCVLQTTLDLIRMGYVPMVCADATTSRRPLDRDIALTRMQQAGAVVTTTESVTLEMVAEAGTDRFKRILPIIK